MYAPSTVQVVAGGYEAATATNRVASQVQQGSSETKAMQAANEEAKAAKAVAFKVKQEADEMKMKLQAALDDAANLKIALADAKLAQAQSVALAAAPRKSLTMSQGFSSFTPLNGGRIIGQMTQEELDTHYDVVIIGGGPVGVAAATKSAVLGHRCIIVDKPKSTPTQSGLDIFFGGPTGLFSKALRDVAKHVDVPSLEAMHLDDDVIWKQVSNSCLRLATNNASSQVDKLENFKIDYLQACATVVNKNAVLVNQGDGKDPSILQTDFVLVATGSKPMRPKEIPFDDFRIFDSDTINTLSYLPKSVAILGSGIIAIEYAKIFRKLGVKVYMIVRSQCLSALERIGLDHDVAAKLIEFLHDDNVDIFENTTVASWDIPASREDGPLTLKLNSKNADVPSQMQVDVFLAAAGRTPNTSGWGAEKLGIKLAPKGGHVQVDEKYETSVPGIFAVGDVIGPPSLASTGVYQAQAAMLEMFGQGHMNKVDSYPIGMWTTPECAYFGMTAAEATKKGIDCKEGMVKYDACLRGRVFAPHGLMKLVFRVDDGVILGVHILGDDACEMIHYGMDLVTEEVTIFKVMTTCFTAVTFHELFKEAALAGNNQLEFGMEWHKIVHDIGAHIDNHEHGFDLGRMKELFHEADEDDDGCLDWKDLMRVFHSHGCDIDRATASNLVRLSAKAGETVIHWDEFQRIFDILEDLRANSHFGEKDDKQAKAQIAALEQEKQDAIAQAKFQNEKGKGKVQALQGELAQLEQEKQEAVASAKFQNEKGKLKVQALQAELAQYKQLQAQLAQGNGNAQALFEKEKGKRKVQEAQAQIALLEQEKHEAIAQAKFQNEKGKGKVQGLQVFQASLQSDLQASQTLNELLRKKIETLEQGLLSAYTSKTGQGVATAQTIQGGKLPVNSTRLLRTPVKTATPIVSEVIGSKVAGA
jgi:NAD(P) transhydrogenase